jgi:hypothetical protein
MVMGTCWYYLMTAGDARREKSYSLFSVVPWVASDLTGGIAGWLCKELVKWRLS